MRIATDKKNMQGRMSDTDKLLLLLCGIKHKISARQDYYVSFMRYGGGGGGGGRFYYFFLKFVEKEEMFFF